MLTAHWPKIAQCHCLYGRGLLTLQWPAGTPELPPALPTPSPNSLSWSCWRVWALCWWPWAILWGQLIPLEGPRDTFFFFSEIHLEEKHWLLEKLIYFLFFTRNEYHITCMIDSLSVWTKKKLTPKFSSHLQSLCQLRNMVEFLFLLLCYKISIF